MALNFWMMTIIYFQIRSISVRGKVDRMDSARTIDLTVAHCSNHTEAFADDA